MNFDVPDEANELYFFKLFISDEVIKDITDQTNLYAKQYFEPIRGNSQPKSRMSMSFLAITLLMGIIKRNNIKESPDESITAPFIPRLMSRNEFHNIMTFFHLVANTNYPARDSPDYDPRKKLGLLYAKLCEVFPALWCPRQHLSIEGYLSSASTHQSRPSTI